MAIQSFNDLEVYKEALSLAVRVHQRLKSFPPAERNRVIDQLSRSSAAIGAHIAEGWGRKDSVADFKRYLRMALGEIQEVKYWLEFSTSIQLLEPDQGRELWRRYNELGARMHALITTWRDFEKNP